MPAPVSLVKAPAAPPITAPVREPRYGDDEVLPVGQDPLALVAVGAGLLGFLFGLVLTLVTAVLGSMAGGRARESGRSFTLPYLAFGLSVLDGVVWIVVHVLTDWSAQVG